MSKERKGGMGGPMGRMGGGPRAVEKAKDFKGTMKKLGVYLKPYSLSIAIVILFAIGSAAFSIVGPKILGKATTKIFEGLVQKITGVPDASIDFGYIGNIAMILVALYLVSSLFGIIQSFIMSGVAQKVSYNLRKQISEKMDTLPLNYFDTRTNGEVLSRITNDVDTVNQTLNQSLSQIITSVVTLIGVLIMMFSISWIMTLATFIILPVSMVLISLVVKKSQKYFKSQQEYLGHLNGQIEEVYGGHNIMKAFNREEASTKDFDELNNTLYKSAWKSQFLSGMMMPIMSFVGNLGYVLVSILGGWLTIKSVITVGDIQAFIQYVRSFNQPISQMAQVANIMQSTAAAAERVFEFLDEEDEVKDPVNSVDPSEIRGEVEFEDVHFGYNEDKIIINDFSVDVKPGQKVAIVGPTGAGKTTIVKLLMRFYDINSGSIKIDGHDIRDFKRADLRNLFGMVLQDTWLFNGTIMENLRYGRLDATDAEVKEAAKAAHVDHFVKTLPDGYNMVLNEDASNISQGQKQLLTIARAFLKDPKLLILDEATSSVDTRTELLIQKAMEKLMEGRTSFIIAHRLSTIRDADLILVMKDGDIVEQGNHEELLEKGGFYSSLYNSQFEQNSAS
ncbi:ABC transporter ATP-binding protein [Clostridium perfringens]|uniref:ABC transporter, permease/ATP-binding protein n=1 Tax=Clostridium perfringens (strain SM101 / Type A) TaxID=289380 RepID=Q0SVM7_CLOPS|nr:ABC transporter ATP-binding protein [Clostridium perfringens]ABG86247.1 ABC transporter, permease/ATP-binding protein [Clostridium perfringens SM101]MBP2860521.1 ABC transporter ATP-binding protein [Clostridium perfringens]MDH5061300.1 putative ABC transporter ATP-binding protein [Clostridium perfringens NCTC 8239]UBK66680.1 ABC transporter ATP-binding protein/permease [Clostridium perfringens]CAG9338350.1 ABC transporter [Clostridium perfringens NCTC 8239]